MELKPCPFCGYKEIKSWMGHGNFQPFHPWIVRCFGCGARIEQPSKKESETNWNKRIKPLDN